MSKTVLIYDDVESRVAEWSDKLKSVLRVSREFEVETLSSSEFIQEMNELLSRQKRARRATRETRNAQTQLDAAAIFVVDYDLLKLSVAGYFTGEASAYLARCYSGCGIIVALNQYGVNPFDLTLRGYPASYADLNIGSDQLANRGLWNDGWSGFRPWSWPLLPKACRSLVSRQQELQTHLDAPIVQHLGISDRIATALPQTARDFLASRRSGRKKIALEQVTFRQFAEESGQGFKVRDKPLGDEYVARVAAARLAQWVECFLLPGQDILVDAPHLAYRYPSLLSGNREEIDSWNRTTSLSAGASIGLGRRKLNNFSFPAEWVSRPAWKWDDLSKQESIKEVKQPWSTEKPNWVFCEDVARFMPLRAAREFLAEVDSPFARRYVANYRSRQVRAKLRAQLQQVVYTPPERLHL